MAAPRRFRIDDSVLRDLAARDLQQRNHRRVARLGHVEQLAQARTRAIEDVVGEHHGEGFVADRRARLQHRIAEAERLALLRDRNSRRAVAAADELEDVVFAARLEMLLEFGAWLEVIDGGGLAGARSEE